ncbi:MAG: ATP-binding cassette domain-containing protein [Acetobacteraceae bacterium]|nr:ATP-binding cassette domain-containing protein [Acetobacteraceae bacterium]
MSEIITVSGLTKVYARRVLAVDGVSFSVEKGEIFGLLGPNGAGKSTTILMLITLIRPTSGQAWVCGYDVARNPDQVRHHVGYVSQDIAVDDTLTGWENLWLQGRLYHLDPALIMSRGRELLDMVDLTDRARDLVSHYSGGMRKRLDIAEGLIHRPAVLFLDEPTLGLDIQTRRRIWEYIERLRREEGVTIFLTTHYMEEADALCDRVAIIDRGRMVALGKPADLKRDLGGDVITVKFGFRTPGGEAATPPPAELAALPGVERVRPLGGDSVSLVVRDGDVAVPRILETLAAAGWPVQAISLKRASLDDVFLHYTGRELREDEGSDAFYRTARALRRARQ